MKNYSRLSILTFTLFFIGYFALASSPYTDKSTFSSIYTTGQGFSLKKGVLKSDWEPYLKAIIDFSFSIPAMVTIDPAGPFCANDAPVTLTATPVGGTWGGAAIGGVFNPAAVGPGIHNVTYSYTFPDGSVGFDDIDILVHPAPNVSVAPAGPFCVNDAPVFLVGTPPGGTWDGPVSPTGLFDPAAAQPGIKVIRYTYTNAFGCVDSADVIIEVFILPFVSITPPPDICASDPPFNLVGNPAGGVWSGDVGPTGIVDPAVLGTGTFSATYTYTDLNGCTNSDMITFTISPSLTVTLNPAGPFCQDDPPVNLTFSPPGGTWSGPVSTSGVFDPSIAGPGFHVVTYSAVSPSGCQGEESIVIEVVQTPNPLIIDPGPLCESDPAIFLTATPPGGTWGGAAPGGNFNPSSLGAGIHNVTYTYTTPLGCTGSTSTDILVNSSPNISIGPAGPFCLNDPPTVLTATPPGGTWSGPIGPNGTFDPATAGPGNKTIRYTYTDPFGCTAFEEIFVLVSFAPNVNISPPPNICESDLPFNLVASPSGGVWSGDVGPNGLVDPSSMGSGGFSATYTYTDVNGCVGSDFVVFTISPSPTVVLGQSGPFCEGDAPINLTFFPPGGTFSGPVSPNGAFDPSAAGPGIHPITYSYVNSEGCEGEASINIEVFQGSAPLIEDPGAICETDATITLTASPTGGVWGGAADPGGSFDPQILGPGTHVVTYNYMGANGCPGSDQLIIEILPLPDLNIQSAGPFCQNGTPFNLVVTPSGGAWMGDVDAAGTVNPTLLGPGIFTAVYTYIDSSGCGNMDSTSFEVLDSIDISFPGDSSFCISQGPLVLEANPSGPNGMWNGAIVSANGEIDPSSLTPGTYTVNYTFIAQGGCEDSKDLTITINAPPAININGDIELCQNAGTTAYTATPLGGSWGGVADTNGDVDVSILSPGTHLVSYSVPYGNGCVEIFEQVITVIPVPSAEISGTGTICPGGISNTDLTVVLTGTAPWQLTYSIDGIPQLPVTINSSPFTLSANQPGDYEIVSVSDAAGCSGIGLGIAMVEELAPLSMSNLKGNCDGTNTNFVLTFTINGGDPASYTVTGLTGTLSGNIFTSNPIPSGTNVAITVSDNSACAPVSDNITIDCSCETEIGSMGNNTIQNCGPATVTAVYDSDGEFLDGDDLVQFILHSNPGISLGTILVVSNAPTFSFDPATMSYGTTFFISAVAGSNDGNGNVDLTDNCLKVAAGTPIVFYELPDAILSGDQVICLGDTATLTINLTGSPPWNVTYNDGSQDRSFNASTSPWTIQVEPSTTTNYTIVNVTDTNCENNGAGNARVIVNQPPSATLTPIFEVCNTDQNNEPTTVDFSMLITAGDRNGAWVDLDNSEATGTFPLLDFDGIAAGDYRFEYTTNSATPPCNESTYTITITVNDCSCPSVETITPSPLCSDDAVLDLSSITVSTEPGTWAITSTPNGSNPATINGTTFNGTGRDAGSYEVQFTLIQMPPAGCPQSSTQTITVFPEVSAGQGPGTLSFCSNAIGSIDLFDQLTGESPGGSWTVINGAPGSAFNPNSGVLEAGVLPAGTYEFEYAVDGIDPCPDDNERITIRIENPVDVGSVLSSPTLCEGETEQYQLMDLLQGADTGGTWTEISTSPSVNGAFDPVSGTFNTTGQVAGTYTFRYEVLATAPCENQQVEVQVTIHPNPVADAGEDKGLTCDTRMAVLGGPGTSIGPNYIYTWSGNGLSDPNNANPDITAPGLFILTVTDTRTGCIATDEVIVSQNEDPPSLDANSIDLTCFGSDNGVIQVENVTGGISPYLYSLNDGPFTSENIFTGLTPGSYTLAVEDANGCKDEVTFVILEPDELTVTLSVNLSNLGNVVSLGDSVLLSANVDGSFDTIFWEPAEYFDPCDPEQGIEDCTKYWVAPTDITTYSVTVIDENGCADSDQITLRVRRDRNVYIPSGFSPNGDGINDGFRIYTDENVEKVKSFLVFDRWGDLVYEYYDFDPDDPAGSWDGTFRGQPMNSAVFAYFAEIEFIDGKVELYKGDVTLVR